MDARFVVDLLTRKKYDLSSSVLMAWSGGKDSALALHEVLRTGAHDVRALLTTVTEGFDRVSMHGVRRSLLHAQASSVELPLEEIWIPKNASNEVYDARMREVLMKYKKEGVREVAFGDLFLQDVRKCREDKLGLVAMRGLFPLWGRDTGKLSREFIELGFRAVVCCVDPRVLPKEYCGREYDFSFLDSLPSGVDPCGENGEFHTFVYAGPIFKNEIAIVKGDVVLRDGFWFADVLPRV